MSSCTSEILGFSALFIYHSEFFFFLPLAVIHTQLYFMHQDVFFIIVANKPPIIFCKKKHNMRLSICYTCDSFFNTYFSLTYDSV